METKEQEIQRHKEQIEFCQRQIDFHKRSFIDAEFYIKIWRVYKMKDENHLYHAISGNYDLWWHQAKKLDKIYKKLHTLYKK